MSDIAIRVENLSKAYQITHSGRSKYRTLQEDVIGFLKRPFSRDAERPRRETFWALKDVSFEVKHGEVLGIIGRNGAGKSTLLKILSRITKPTSGYAEIYGRVGSLLEVGTGFHPELTGRENIFLNGAVLGMSRRDIQKHFDEIVAFADVEQFLDTPAKRYSSGMYMRLAFAVAAHLEPEVLVVDEVLAVGDAEFQKKCLGKMSEVAKSGRTVLFVSHNMVAVQNLCSAALWLQNGRIHALGEVLNVVSGYVSSGASELTERTWDNPEVALGNGAVRFRRMAVRPLDGRPTDLMTAVTPILLEFEYWNLKSDAKLNLSLVLENERGEVVFNTFPIHEPMWGGKPFPTGLFYSSVIIPGYLLNDGYYNVELYVVEDESTVLFREKGVLSFEIVDSPERRGKWYGKIIGTVHPKLEWSTVLLEQELKVEA
jgi:lipopolysaccharide transport system ATP-binding protein